MTGTMCKKTTNNLNGTQSLIFENVLQPNYKFFFREGGARAYQVAIDSLGRGGVEGKETCKGLVAGLRPALHFGAQVK